MRFALIGILSLLPIAASAEVYQLFEENGKIGLKNKKGVVVIKAAFEALGWADGSFSVIGETTGYKLNNHWGLINLKSRRITDPLYESLVPSQGDKIIASKKIDPVTTKVGCINLEGKFIIPFKYDELRISGTYVVAVVRTSNRLHYGILDFNNKEVVPIKFRRIYSIGSLRFGVENFEGKTALFSEFGKQITEFTIDSVSFFRKKYAIIYEGLNQGLVDRDGNIIVDPAFREIRIDENGSIFARELNRWHVKTINNEIIHSTDGDNVKLFGDFFRIEIASRTGLLDQHMALQVPLQYRYLGETQSSQMVARSGRKYGTIRKNNSIVLPFQYDSIILEGKYLRVQKRPAGKTIWSLYDTFGIKKTGRSYEFIKPFNGQFFEVKNYGHAGVVNRYGKEIIPCVYDSLIDYNDVLIHVQYHGQYGVIDYNENWLLPPQSYLVEMVDSNHYLRHRGSMTYFKNYQGELIYFTDNTIEVRDSTLKEVLPDGTEKVIDFHGITISRTAAPMAIGTQIISSEKEGFRGIKRHGKFGFIDANGRLRIANRYEGIGEFSNGLAAVKILGKWGYVDSSDKIAINPTYEYASPFSKSTAIVKRQGYGLVDKNGRVVLKTRYDSIFKIGTGNFVLLKGNLRGLADSNGKILIEPRFEILEDLGNGFVIVSNQSKYGVLTRDGLSAIPMTHDLINYLPTHDQYLVKEESPWVRLTVE